MPARRLGLAPPVRVASEACSQPAPQVQEPCRGLALSICVLLCLVRAHGLSGSDRQTSPTVLHLAIRRARWSLSYVDHRAGISRNQRGKESHTRRWRSPRFRHPERPPPAHRPLPSDRQGTKVASSNRYRRIASQFRFRGRWDYKDYDILSGHRPAGRAPCLVNAPELERRLQWRAHFTQACGYTP